MNIPLVTKSSNQKPDFAEGCVLLIDKPYDWSSFDVVKKIKYTLKIDKIGHAGTLDPLATGLLILCTGKMTKQIDHFQGMEKEYSGTLCLGKTTPSYDLETEPDTECNTDHLLPEDLYNAAEKFKGLILQKPPVFSAIKVAGKPVYKKARKGIEVELKHREVLISEFKLTSLRIPEADFFVRCSKGTYIRSLVHDYGQMLQCGGHLTALRRTAIGSFRVEDAWELSELFEFNKKLHEGL